VQYGQIELTSQAGMNLHFQVSNLSLAQQFAQALSYYIDFYKKPHSDSSSRTSSRTQEEQSKPKSNSKPQVSGTYTVLNVPTNASKEEITSAYKKLAQQYHPDKVASLAPEFKELAEKRMKEINAAYRELIDKFKE
jgi:DnaJ like chaperone protein